MIGIIGAMESETKGLKDLIQDKKIKTIAGIEFVSGKLFDKDIRSSCNFLIQPLL